MLKWGGSPDFGNIYVILFILVIVLERRRSGTMTPLYILVKFLLGTSGASACNIRCSMGQQLSHQWLLPELVAAQVAQHLSPRDLAACCGVSRHWRLIFNTDQLWKPLCDPLLEEPLRTTPCVVEPPFSLPEPPDSTLAPIGQWRAAFLREQHLQSNYRSGNYKTVELTFEDKKQVEFVGFVSDDFLIICYRGSVELLDVRSLPPICVDKLAISSEEYSVKVYKNGFVILRDELQRFFHVLKVDSTEGTIASKYWIYITETSESDEMVFICSSLLESDRESIYLLKILPTSGTRCIGYFKYRNSFHIFDLERGVKVKEQFGPLNLDYKLTIVGPLKGCNNCHDVLMFQTKIGCTGMQDLKPEQLENANHWQTIHCYVYDVERLVFWPFNRTYSDYFEYMAYGILNPSLSVIESCAIINDFVALSECDYRIVRIFNYKTGDEIHYMAVDYVWPTFHVIDSSCQGDVMLLMFVCEVRNTSATLYGVILPSGVVVKDVTGKLFKRIKVIGRRQVIIESERADNTLVIWYITQREKKKIFKTALKFDNICSYFNIKHLIVANQIGTRLTYKTDVENKKTQRLVYLW